MPRMSNAYQAVLRSSIDSKKLARAGRLAHELYMRLLIVSDGYGRFHGSAFQVCARAYPDLMESGQVTPELIESDLEALEREGLIVRYEVDGDRLLEVCDYYDPTEDQRRKSVFPAPSPVCPQHGDTAPPSRPHAVPLNSNSNSNHNSKAGRASAREADLDGTPESAAPAGQPASQEATASPDAAGAALSRVEPCTRANGHADPPDATRALPGASTATASIAAPPDLEEARPVDVKPETWAAWIQAVHEVAWVESGRLPHDLVVRGLCRALVQTWEGWGLGRRISEIQGEQARAEHRRKLYARAKETPVPTVLAWWRDLLARAESSKRARAYITAALAKGPDPMQPTTPREATHAP